MIKQLFFPTEWHLYTLKDKNIKQSFKEGNSQDQAKEMAKAEEFANNQPDKMKPS